jgi:hypothetical protein
MRSSWSALKLVWWNSCTLYTVMTLSIYKFWILKHRFPLCEVCLHKTQQNKIQAALKMYTNHQHTLRMCVGDRCISFKAACIWSCCVLCRHTSHKGNLCFIIQNSFKKSVTTVYKVQQFHQTNFSTPDEGLVGRNMLCNIGQVNWKKN